MRTEVEILREALEDIAGMKPCAWSEPGMDAALLARRVLAATEPAPTSLFKHRRRHDDQIPVAFTPSVKEITPDRYEPLLGGHIAAYFDEPVGTVEFIGHYNAAALLSGKLRWEHQVRGDGSRWLRLAQVDTREVIYAKALHD